MVHPEGDSSNALFSILRDWNHILETTSIGPNPAPLRESKAAAYSNFRDRPEKRTKRKYVRKARSNG
jgi:hypothetical protein